jgi:hypothetical protein
MTWQRSILRGGGVAVAVGGLVAAGCGEDAGTNTGTEPAAGEQVAVANSRGVGGYAWVSDGRVVAIRRGPATDEAYGAHGVDYSAGTAACDRATP